MSYSFHQKVLFRHCDPAGIVYYPRYFDMVNDCIESFFADVLEAPFETMHKGGSVPTVQTHTTFTAPSLHGDQLVLSLTVDRIGETSMSYSLTAACDAEQRFTTTATLVNVDKVGRPMPWAHPIRERLTQFKDALQ